MIGAVTTTVGTNTPARVEAEIASGSQSFAANPDRLQIAPPVSKGIEQGATLATAGFVSPVVRVDATSKVAVLEFRDGLTGDVVAQIPSKEQLRAYRVRQAKQDAAITQDTSSDTQLAKEAQAEGRSEPVKVDTSTITPQDYVKYESKVDA